jgi:hypothetical protein
MSKKRIMASGGILLLLIMLSLATAACSGEEGAQGIQGAHGDMSKGEFEVGTEHAYFITVSEVPGAWTVTAHLLNGLT